jgi:hypothetical protein
MNPQLIRNLALDYPQLACTAGSPEYPQPIRNRPRGYPLREARNG